MVSDVAALKDKIGKQIEAAADLKELEAIRVASLGKKGEITALVKGLGAMPPEERRAAGQAFNALKTEIEANIQARQAVLADAELDARLEAEKLDVTLPPRQRKTGRIHPVSQVTDEVIAIFADMGFSVAEGPDIEDDFHNFEALNLPPEHPARQMHDTFYLTNEQAGAPLLLRTHTSPVQIRTMLNGKPPFRIIAPGRTYRRDSDMTHTPMFHQVEGLLIDRVTHMGHLKGCLIDFVRAFFERDGIPVRFRPSFFPFTEPSAEVDIGCKRSKGELVVGEGDDWLEDPGLRHGSSQSPAGGQS